jgi:DNA polymerase-1
VGDPGADVVGELRRAGVGRGDLVALAVGPAIGLGIAWGRGTLAVPAGGSGVGGAVRAVEDEVRPRWVVWSGETAAELVRAGVRVAACWDVAAVQRLLVGGWRAEPARVWAQLHDLALDGMPAAGPPDLFSLADHDRGDPEDPVRDDGHLRADWVDGGWAASPDRLARWAALALDAAGRQRIRLAALDGPARPGRAAATARSESAAELLCAELSADGLPLDRAVAEDLIAGFAGPRPRSPAEAAALRAERDALVLAHVPDARFDLRSPGQVRSLLRRVGIEVPDTRAWRLEAIRDAHPVIDALLAWRKAERVATTYAYAWLDEHLGADGRLRGAWTGCDGAAGRMTASAGLHNMPADLRSAVVAEPGHVFVRADLGQIEPRVLAAVSGDRALADATAADDMYAPVADQLGVDRPTAKVAMLGAMYGQVAGHGAPMQRRLGAAYPVAMASLEDADRAGQAGRDLRTYGGRAIRMSSDAAAGAPPDVEAPVAPAGGERHSRARAAARGRYGRNALVQGAAAELFKAWAATVRARAVPHGARIVLCLHDELLVHAPAAEGPAVAGLVDACLQEAARRWAPGAPVRFVADVAVLDRWSDAKP